MKRTPSSPSSPTHKASRTTASKSNSANPLLCTLPPTCSTHPTALADTRELEAHYAKYHAWVCQAAKPTSGTCGNVFPDARLLELHHTECHDPIAAVMKERGEKTFACFLPHTVCPKVFASPKARRLHLIAVHGYPKEYFFAVVNKGVAGLLAKWGDGAGMIRRTWKPRPKEGEQGSNSNKNEDGQEDSEGTTDSEESEDSSEPETTTKAKIPNGHQPSSMAMDIDALATSFQTSLSVSSVPSSIRFGRGAKRGTRGGRGANSITLNSHRYRFSDPDEEAAIDTSPSRGRGGYRGGRVMRGSINRNQFAG